MGSALTTITRVGPQRAVDPTAFGCGGLNFSWGDHICAIFDSPNQQMAMMLPFMIQGLRAEQRCVWIGAPPSADRFRRALAEMGADLPTLEASGQLIIVPEVDSYLHDGLFDPERTLELGRILLEDGRRNGWSEMRITGDASFLRDRPVDSAGWESYEEEVARRVAGAPLVAVCQYDRRCLPASLIDVALHTHPIVIVGEAVYRNPLFEEDWRVASAPLEVS